MSDRVLVIDDSLPVHRLLHSHLTDQGVECISAYDGERGLTLAAQEHPGLILLDVDLPGKDGFEVCTKLRNTTATSRIPIMFLTADYATADKIRGLEMGAVDYITKPCNFAELTARVKAAMRMRQAADEEAMRDTLTGLWSKAYLDHHLISRISMARRAGQPLSCIVADIDNLARINEKFGRGIGDDAICSVGHALANLSGTNDVACAFRGGTFAILGANSDRHGAARLAMRFGTIIGGELGERGELEIDLSCSFGIADIEVARGDSLVERAHSAMRRAKANGPGSVSVARPQRHTIGRLAA